MVLNVDNHLQNLKSTQIQPNHYGTSLNNYRQVVGNDIDKGCIVCGEKKKHRLTIHHIDAKRKNNDRKNLEVLCWNHHVDRHLKKYQGEWGYHTRSLTPRDIVAKLDKEEMVKARS